MADVWLRSPAPPGANDVELFTNLTIYWVGGTGNWNDDQGHWATSSGGLPAKGNNPPTNITGLGAPSVVFDANSNAIGGGGNYTVTSTATNNSVYSIAFDNPGSGVATVSGAQVINCNGNFTRLNGAWSNVLALRSDVDTTQKTFTSTGGSVASVSIGVSMAAGAGSWKLLDALNTNANTVTLVGGTLDTNSQTCSIGSISWSGAVAKTLTLGASTFNMSGNWTMNAASNNTLNAGTSTVNVTGNTSTLSVGSNGFTFNNVAFSAASPSQVLLGTASYANLSFATSAVSTNTWSIQGTHTITGTLTFAPTGTAPQSNRGFLTGFSPGVQFSLVVHAVSGLADFDFADANVSGAAIPLTGTRVGDVGNNSGITFNAPLNKFWIGNTANWTSANWALTSGGAGDVLNFPLPQDTVIIDANSFSANNQQLTVGSGAGGVRIPNIDWSGLTRTGITWLFNISTDMFCGDVTLSPPPTLTITASQTVGVIGRRTQTFRSNGNNLGGTPISLQINSGIGKFVLADDILLPPNGSSNATLLATGTLDLNGHVFWTGTTTVSQPSANDGVTQTLNRTLTSRGGFFQSISSGTIFSAGDPTGLVITDPALLTNSDLISGAKNFTGAAVVAGGLLLKNLTIACTGAGPAGMSGSFFGSADFSKFSGAVTFNGFLGFCGNVKFGPSMTFTGGGNTTQFYLDSGVQTFDSAGLSMNIVPQLIGAGTLRLLSPFDASAGAATLTLGTLDLNGYEFDCLSLTSNNSNVRTLMSGKASAGINDIVLRNYTPPGAQDVELFQYSSVVNGKIKTLNTGVATVWNYLTSTNAVIDRTNPWSIEIGGNSASVRTFNGGGLTYPALTFSNTTGAGELDFVGNNTFKSLGITTPPQSLKFTAASTTTVEQDSGLLHGSSGNLLTITSITAANHNLVKSGGGTISSPFSTISRSQATPSANPPGTWFAGRSSTDGGNNTGWIFADLFTDSVSESGNAVDSFDGNVVQVYNVSVSEAGAAADAVDATTSFLVAITEAGTAADTIDAKTAFAVAISEAGAAADTVDAKTAFAVAISEAGAAADSVSATAVFLVAISETGAAADAASASVIANVSVSESGSAADSTNAFVTAVISESGAAADSTSATKITSGTIVEAGSATDLSSNTIVTSGSIVEAGAATDAVAGSRFVLASVLEVGVASELLTATRIFSGTIVETLFAADVFNGYKPYGSAVLSSSALGSVALSAVVITATPGSAASSASTGSSSGTAGASSTAGSAKVSSS